MSSNEWPKVNLGDVVDTISQKHKFDKDKIILVNTSDVLEGKVLNHEYVPNINLKGQFKKSFQKLDILYSEIRPQNKRFAYVDFDSEDYVASTKLMVLRKKNDSITPDFLYQVLKSEDVINRLQVIAESRSGTFPQITFAELSRLNILLPPLKEQKEIAETLSCIDNKIQLNNSINKNLEEIAKTIFKSWFVDFEPFQNREFEDSEIGRIPKGWSVATLEDIVESIDNRGKTPPLSSQITPFPIIDVKALSDDSRIIDFNNCTKYVEEDTYNNWFRSGHPRQQDILISTVGSLAEMKIFYGTKGCVAQNVVGFRSKGLSPLYLYQYLQNIKQDLISYNIGSVQPSIKVTHIIKHKILIPDEETLNLFDITLKTISNKIFENTGEIQKLIEIRDALLQKLMSGEIRVPIEGVQ